MKILITGGCGFIGSNLAIYLKETNPAYEITCLDNLMRRGSELNIKRLEEKDIIFRHGDIRNVEDIEAVGYFDCLIECSAEPSVHSGYGSSASYLVNTNLVGAINCFEAAVKHKSRVIFLSTSRVYPIKPLCELPFSINDTRYDIPESKKGQGWSHSGISEDFSLAGVRSLYGATKLCSELMLQEYCSANGIECVINRFGVVAGPWQMGKVDQGFVSLWIARHIYKDKQLSYTGFGGNGLQVRDVLHVKDLCELVELQLKSFDRVKNRVFNVGGGIANSVSLLELTGLCRDLTGNCIEISSVLETKQFDIPYYVSDNSLIKEVLSWNPRYTIYDTITDVKNWILDNQKVLKSIFN